ncbi:hypothetical protein SAMN04487945_2561 [Halobacterium jilantaiense]|uniref:Uncharacterized protein n=2 Tax=Halobacterium jilantaiense TaxID=355548 RepID=A0A1I0QFF3_9EURY|nr:hypothetical protein SAMN04487945_2561 [Halobacterium jilantaiense]
MYVEDGARIAAILLVWGVVAAFFLYGATELGVFGRAFARLGQVFVYAGVLNAILYVAYRTLDYHHALAADR